jgi:hypothetical protein
LERPNKKHRLFCPAKGLADNLYLEILIIRRRKNLWTFAHWVAADPGRTAELNKLNSAVKLNQIGNIYFHTASDKYISAM